MYKKILKSWILSALFILIQGCGDGFEVLKQQTRILKSINNDNSSKDIHDSNKLNTHLIESARPLLMDRVLLSSRLTQVFDDDNDPTEINNPDLLRLLSETIKYQPEAFGRPCTFSEVNKSEYNYQMRASCSKSPHNSRAPLRPVSTNRREGFRIKTCEKIAENDKMITNAIQLIRKNSSQYPSAGDIELVYSSFFVIQQITPEIKKSLSDLVTYSRSQGHNELDSWRFLWLSVCLAPGWQIM